MPLYRVKLNGLAIEAVEPLFYLMVTAKEVNDSLKIKTFNSLSQIGITPGSENSLLQVTNAMPNYSILNTSITNLNTSLYPKSWGEATFLKFENRTRIIFTSQNVTDSNKLAYFYMNYTVNDKETGWFNVSMSIV